MPFSSISSGTLFHNLSSVFPLFKFFLSASSLTSSVNTLKCFVEINYVVIVLRWIGERRNQAREFN